MSMSPSAFIDACFVVSIRMSVSISLLSGGSSIAAAASGDGAINHLLANTLQSAFGWANTRKIYYPGRVREMPISGD